MSALADAAVPQAEAKPPTSRQGVQLGLLVLLGVFPFLPGASGYLGMASQAAIFTIIAASLVLLTGWVGQISLAHAALVGVGAYATGWAATSLGLVFPLSLPVGAAAGALVAAGLGIVALRVRGLYLAVATLIFSWAASEFLFRQDWVTTHGSAPAQTLGRDPSLLFLDFGSRRTFYYAAWLVTVAVLYALVNLRDSRSGRAFFALRGSEMAAASLGMDVLRYKLLGFGLSGALAGIAGSLTMTNARVVSPSAFDFESSLFFLAIAVVGGLTSLAGGVAAGWVFAGMEEMFFRVEVLNPYLTLTGAALLAIVFRAYPGGLASLGVTLVGRGRERIDRIRALPQRTRDRLERTATMIPYGAERPRAVPGETAGAQAGGESADGEAAAHGAAGATEAGADDADATTELPELRQLAEIADTRPASPLRRVLHAAGAPARIVLNLDDRMRAAVARRLLAFADRRGGEAAGGRSFLDLDASDLLAEEPSSNGDGPHEDDEERTEAQAAQARLIERSEERRPDVATREQRPALIDASHITVRFGGLTAVNDANLTVREGEICGLIGPNGAGKTTLFNSIAGFNRPTEGTVYLYGQDVTSMSVHERAQLGVSRTFQIIQLFSELTVFDNLLAATHLQNPTGFIQHMAVTPTALTAEAAARGRVQRVVDLLDLGEVAHRPVAGLPFGILRMVEVARALVSGAKVIMLDEPASGLDEHETDQLSDVLRLVRGLGATLLLIEHDVRMVTAVTDYLHVLNQGEIIAEGPPAQIQDDPAVIAAYLGQSTADAGADGDAEAGGAAGSAGTSAGSSAGSSGGAGAGDESEGADETTQIPTEVDA